LLWGPVKSESLALLQDGTWNEKMLIIILTGVIIAAGTMPYLLSSIIKAGL
jgi:NADH:ubiquinone oxidoreductase subunit 4 (subunit M)